MVKFLPQSFPSRFKLLTMGACCSSGSPPLPYPGVSKIECTGNLQQDLRTLQQKYVLISSSFFEFSLSLIKKKHRYPQKYKDLMNREMCEAKRNEISDLNVINKNSITVMQFNMLADGLCGAYTNKINDKTFLNVDKECLQWTYRGIKICEEILRFEPDIIGIEECDQLEYLMKYLKPKGYESFYQIKTTSPIKKICESLSAERNEEIKMNLDGVAIIYKKNKFKIINDNDIQKIDTNNEYKVFGLAIRLNVKSINKDILFIVTHLKSTKTLDGEKLREKQINLLLKNLIKNDDNLPIILCCDLNANPKLNKKGYQPLCYNSLTNSDLGYESVYELANGKEPDFTTFKLREKGQDKHTIDYIFINGGKWNVIKTLNIPNEGLIPNWNYPSDHFSLMAQLCWK